MTLEDAKILQTYWHLVSDELESYIQNETLRLRTCGETELKSIQAFIKAYQGLKTLPYDVAERLASRG